MLIRTIMQIRPGEVTTELIEQLARASSKSDRSNFPISPRNQAINPTTMAAARMAISSSLSRISSSSFSARLTPRRSLASAADHIGPAKVNIWQDPLSPSKWKEEHFVLASLSGWFFLIYGASKAFGGKKEEAIVAPAN